jgi:hypothetical protein
VSAHSVNQPQIIPHAPPLPYKGARRPKGANRQLAPAAIFCAHDWEGFEVSFVAYPDGIGFRPISSSATTGIR